MEQRSYYYNKNTIPPLNNNQQNEQNHYRDCSPILNGGPRNRLQLRNTIYF